MLISCPMMNKLPKDIFFNILSRLPITDLLICKNVCRQWLESLRDPAFAILHFSGAAVNNLSLIFQSENYYWEPLQIVEMDDHFDALGLKMKRMKLPLEWWSSYKLKVVGSCNGFLCLYNASLQDDPIFLFNPFTREYLILPELMENTWNNSSVVFGFGYIPKSKSYKVIKILYDEVLHFPLRPTSVRSNVWVLTVGSSEWRNIGAIPYRLVGPASEALVDGKLHWLAQSCNSNEVQVVSFNLEKEQFRIVPQPDCSRTLCCPYNSHLLALEGCLSMVIAYPMQQPTEIWIMKNYNVKESWIKECVIPKYGPELFSEPPTIIHKNGSNRRAIRVLCRMQNGEMVLLYSSRKLVAFHPQHKTFRPLELEGLPSEFQAVLHTFTFMALNQSHRL